MLLEDRSMADGRYTASSASESAVEHAPAGREPRKGFDLQEVGVRGGGGLAIFVPFQGKALPLRVRERESRGGFAAQLR